MELSLYLFYQVVRICVCVRCMSHSVCAKIPVAHANTKSSPFLEGNQPPKTYNSPGKSTASIRFRFSPTFHEKKSFPVQLSNGRTKLPISKSNRPRPRVPMATPKPSGSAVTPRLHHFELVEGMQLQVLVLLPY